MARRTVRTVVLTSLLAGAVGVGGAVLPVPAPSAAAEVSPPATAGELVLRGGGFGHGRGMSQYGARGAATQGVGWQRILDFYYPGTARSGAGTGSIRVHISADRDGEMRLDPAPVATVLRNGSQTLSLPADRTYRVVRAGTAQELQVYDAAAAAYQRYPHALATGTTLELSRPGRLVPLVLPGGTRQEVRGALRAVTDGSTLRTVAVLGMDDYLRGVVPAEMPASWPLEALTAQAVAARTYAARLRATNAKRGWDACDTVSCQVFRGTATTAGTKRTVYEQARTDEAVARSAGVVLTYAGSLALTEFSSSNGGWTSAGGPAYQVAKADPWDGATTSSVHSWTVKASTATLQKRWPAIGTFRRLVVEARDGQGRWGGRVTRVRLEGSAGSVRVTGDQLRSALGLRSTYWTTATVDGYPRDWDGDLAADLLAVRSGGDLLLYPGNGSGGFGTARRVGVGWQGVELVTRVGDLTGDGNGDVVARRTSDGALLLYRGNGSGGFAGSVVIGSGWRGMTRLVGPGDWDGDGTADLLAVHTDGSLLLYRGDGRGRVVGGARVGWGWHGIDLVVGAGDMDGDRAPDLVARVGATAELRLYRGSGSGGFAGTRRIGTGWGGIDTVVGVGDWDGSGTADLVARARDGRLLAYPGTGSGTLDPGRQVGHGWSALGLVP